MSAAPSANIRQAPGWARRAWRHFACENRSSIRAAQWAAVFLLMAALFWALAAWSPEWLMDADGKQSLRRFQIVLLIMAGGSYAIYRVSANHPALQRSYRIWLDMTPWKFPAPLPLGAVLPRPIDGVMLAVLSAPFLLMGCHVLVGPGVFLAVYTVALTGCLLLVQETVCCHVVVALLGLAVCEIHRPWACLGVLVLALGAACLGTRRSLTRFPWPESNRFFEAIPKRSSQASPPRSPSQVDPGWPHGSLLGPPRVKPISQRNALLMALQAGWWTYVIIGRMSDVLALIAPEFVGLFVSIAALCGFAIGFFRLLQYLNGHLPPLSKWGRVMLGRWLFPKYDQVFVAPLACLAAAPAILWVSLAIGIPVEIGAGLAIASAAHLALALGPAYQHWRLAGGARVGPIRQNPNSPQEIAPI